jgi:hypothetical protein
MGNPLYHLAQYRQITILKKRKKVRIIQVILMNLVNFDSNYLVIHILKKRKKKYLTGG